MESIATEFGGLETWPELPLGAWKETYEALHLRTQVVGKIRMLTCAPVNHWWHVSLAVTSRGLTTGPMPYGNRTFQIDFDLLHDELVVVTGEGQRAAFALSTGTVAQFYAKTLAALSDLGISVSINALPQEMPGAIPFDHDHRQLAYDPEYARRCWRILVQTDRVCREFRGRFIGKASPVQFFWGSFDLAVTRFSGRRAPERGAGGGLPESVTNEAYSHEVSSCDWWPGGGPMNSPAFYSYAYPEPPGFKEARVIPAAAHYAAELGEFILPYDAVRSAADPDSVLLDFFQSTYDVAADLGKWDRGTLER